MDFESQIFEQEGAAFRMEYVTYILIILGVMALCLVVFRRREQYIELRSSRPFVAGSAGTESTGEQSYGKLTQENRLNVPTPWGWPGSDSAIKAAEDRTVSETLHRFVDHLITEKQTVEDSEYLLKRNESLRLLMEDRYGMSRRVGSGSVKTKKNTPGPEGNSLVLEQREMKDVRTPWGW